MDRNRSVMEPVVASAAIVMAEARGPHLNQLLCKSRTLPLIGNNQRDTSLPHPHRTVAKLR
jgi:hypothetical protein